MEKKKEENLVNRSQSASTRGVKRSSKDEENENTEETKKRRRQEPNKREETSEEDLMDSKKESNDNSQSETSFMDLPDDIHLIIFGFLDLPTRLKLRLNKRLDRLHFAVKATMKRIIFDTTGPVSHLRTRRDNRAPVNSSNYIEWEKSLDRFTRNTFVYRISIYVGLVLNEEHRRIIDTLFQFNACFLEVVEVPSRRIEVSHLTFPSVVILAENVSHVRFDGVWPSLSAKDLCIIRKTMLEGSFMKSLKVPVGNEFAKSFMKECFGVIIEDVSEPVPGKIYRCEDRSLELYALDSCLAHYEGHFFTCVDNHSILIKKLRLVRELDDQRKIQLNQLLPD